EVRPWPEPSGAQSVIPNLSSVRMSGCTAHCAWRSRRTVSRPSANSMSSTGAPDHIGEDCPTVSTVPEACGRSFLAQTPVSAADSPPALPAGCPAIAAQPHGRGCTASLGVSPPPCAYRTRTSYRNDQEPSRAQGHGEFKLSTRLSCNRVLTGPQLV